MVNICGHLRDRRRLDGFYDESVPLLVNCCGKQIFKNHNYFLKREKGRLDYQIIYIYRGAGHFCLNGEWTALAAGNVVLFRPSEPQFYSYYAADKPEVYWIHFTGNACEGILDRYSIENCYIGESSSVRQLFHLIITELQFKKIHYEDVVAGNFYILLSMIHRSLCNALRPSENDFSIDRLICEINSRYMENWTVASMADFCKLSESYFSHTFKQRMGVPPMQFLSRLRIEKAKEFLTANSMSVSTVARLVGYDDPLYFSRVFRKSTGIAPHKFYHSIACANTPEWFWENE
ncbi:AraC family transcriptional regulator [Schaedlerella arabinosiphila]|uniref:AraC family transcriptional regulator n=1 Tax=Schaedlerella arabinosiphila TaxID=2044587 RepID=A0A3R8LC72_9FIRM|nr:AraC family transcriptional regulator [Schaedlerella arabinosiphila]RRK30097.1 AraC family transcriptional regulator [Schaedlerella arabinosiphila]